MITERHFKNEDGIKALIVNAHNRGVCDRNGASVRNSDGIFIAKPLFAPSSMAKTYILREGKMVLKNG